MDRERRPGSHIYTIAWPTEVAPRDAARVRGYVAEGFPGADSAARVLVEQATTAWTLAKARAAFRLSSSPDRFGITKNSLNEHYTFYAGPANKLLRTREIEARGPQMPPLLPPRVDALLEKLATVNPAEAIAELRGHLIDKSFRQYQDEARLLRELQTLGPIGLVDLEAQRTIELFSEAPRGREAAQSVEAGRMRFHQLYEAL